MIGEATKDDAKLGNHRAAVKPVTLVIFGGAGDPSPRELLPALYHPYVDSFLARRGGRPLAPEAAPGTLQPARGRLPAGGHRGARRRPQGFHRRSVPRVRPHG